MARDSSVRPISVRAIPVPIWQVKLGGVQPLERLQHRPVGLAEQSFGDVNSIIGIDADEMGVERSVMDFR